jgi:hypothetical protein
MAVTTTVRGNWVTFLAQFYDANCNAVFPDMAELYVNYNVGGVPDLATVALEPTVADPNVWSAQWSTDGIDAGRVYWSVRAHLGPQTIVQDGSFTVSTNPANQP